MYSVYLNVCFSYKIIFKNNMRNINVKDTYKIKILYVSLMLMFFICFLVSVIDERPKMKIDVVFAVGAAGRDANEVFDKEKEITNSFIDNLKDNDARFAVIEFGHKATVKSHLGEERDAGKLKASVKEMTRSGDGKCLDKVLEQAVQIFHNEARPASTRVLLVLTNAKSSARTNDLKKHAQSLHEAGVKVQVVAVGNDINEEELKQMTSEQVPLLRVQPYEEPQSVVHNAAWILGGKIMY